MQIATRKYRIINNSLTQKSKENPPEDFHNSARKWKRIYLGAVVYLKVKRNPGSKNYYTPKHSHH
jgi:hypothetical protein